MMESFKNQTAIVTGASRGIGLAIAEDFARQGMNLQLVSTNQEKIDLVAKNLAEKYSIQAFGWACDVSKVEEVQETLCKMLEQISQVHILVNNAGITRDGLLMRMKETDFEQVLQVNLSSVFYFSKAVIRSMMKQQYGRIVNMSSIIGVRGQAGQANYAASKAGIIGFTKSFAREFAKKGITCNAIAPGFIRSDMTDKISDEDKQQLLSEIPTATFGEVEDVAGLVSYLASPQARYITGQVVGIDGGMGI